jgi:hypothetical protein
MGAEVEDDEARAERLMRAYCERGAKALSPEDSQFLAEYLADKNVEEVFVSLGLPINKYSGLKKVLAKAGGVGRSPTSVFLAAERSAMASDLRGQFERCHAAAYSVLRRYESLLKDYYNPETHVFAVDRAVEDAVNFFVKYRHRVAAMEFELRFQREVARLLSELMWRWAGRIQGLNERVRLLVEQEPDLAWVLQELPVESVPELSRELAPRLGLEDRQAELLLLKLLGGA